MIKNVCFILSKLLFEVCYGCDFAWKKKKKKKRNEEVIVIVLVN